MTIKPCITQLRETNPQNCKSNSKFRELDNKIVKIILNYLQINEQLSFALTSWPSNLITSSCTELQAAPIPKKYTEDNKALVSLAKRQPQVILGGIKATKAPGQPVLLASLIEAKPADTNPKAICEVIKLIESNSGKLYALNSLIKAKFDGTNSLMICEVIKLIKKDSDKSSTLNKLIEAKFPETNPEHILEVIKLIKKDSEKMSALSKLIDAKLPDTNPEAICETIKSIRNNDSEKGKAIIKLIEANFTGTLLQDVFKAIISLPPKSNSQKECLKALSETKLPNAKSKDICDVIKFNESYKIDISELIQAKLCDTTPKEVLEIIKGSEEQHQNILLAYLMQARLPETIPDEILKVIKSMNSDSKKLTALTEFIRAKLPGTNPQPIFQEIQLIKDNDTAKLRAITELLARNLPGTSPQDIREAIRSLPTTKQLHYATELSNNQKLTESIRTTLSEITAELQAETE